MRRRGFTLVELLVAGVITAFVLGGVTMSLSQLGRAKNTSKVRFDAHIRADAALTAIRKDIISITRADDLFYTRFLLIDDTFRIRDEWFDRDEVILFNTRVKPLRNIEFGGEGFEYETQYRIADDDLGPALWSRHDALPDEFPAGGGKATPVAEGVIGLMIEAYDGKVWYNSWDSDLEGLPVAVRITVTASGHRGPDDVYQAPRAMMRTVVPIDRVLIPKDLLEAPEEEEAEEETPEEGAEEALDGLPEDIGEFTGGGAQIPRPGRGGGPGDGRGPDGPRRGPGGGRGPKPGPGGGGGPTGAGPS